MLGFVIGLGVVWLLVVAFVYFFDIKSDNEKQKILESKNEKLLQELGEVTEMLHKERSELRKHRSLEARVISHTAGSLELKYQIEKSEKKIKSMESLIREIEKELM